MKDTIQLQANSFQSIPFQIYDKDFTFIVNNEKFYTNKMIADMLSPVISRHHLTDPTLNEFTIQTKSRGRFQFFLDLLNFEEIEIPEDEKVFVIEISTILQNEAINIKIKDKEINEKNVFDDILQHEKYQFCFKDIFEKEINYISENFSEICKKQKEQLSVLSEDTIKLILKSEKLQLESEDQLLSFIIHIYSKSENYSKLLKFVNFLNVSTEKIEELLSIFNFADLTRGAWNSLSCRLKQPIINNVEKEKNDKIPSKQRKLFLYRKKNFEGIFNYFQSNGNFEKFVNITASSTLSPERSQNNVILHNDTSKWFASQDQQNSWICFDFKENKVNLTNYVLKSYDADDEQHPKNWIIEGSNDNKNWDKIDEKINCDSLCGKSRIYAFSVQDNNDDEFRYIRMRQTGPTMKGKDFLLIDSIEFYGELV